MNSSGRKQPIMSMDAYIEVQRAKDNSSRLEADGNSLPLYKANNLLGCQNSSIRYPVEPIEHRKSADYSTKAKDLTKYGILKDGLTSETVAELSRIKELNSVQVTSN